MSGRKSKETPDYRLIDDYCIPVSSALACVLGLNEAIFVQQIHYWLKNKAVGKTVDGRQWVYNSMRQWGSDNFQFWSNSTIRRTADRLIDQGIVLVRNDLNKKGYDRTLSYSIDYETLLLILNKSSGSKWTIANSQIRRMDSSNLDDTIPDTTSDNTTDINPSLEGVKNEYEIVVSKGNSFDEWFLLYGKFKAEDACRKLWDALTPEEREKAVAHTKPYVTRGMGSDPTYRSHPEKYLRDREFNDKYMLLPRKDDPISTFEGIQKSAKETLDILREREKNPPAGYFE